MTGRADPAEALAQSLAYVDNCLDPAARRDFEARLSVDAELRREVALWEAQNREIRLAFGAPRRDALDLGRVTNENGPRRVNENGPRRVNENGPRRPGEPARQPGSAPRPFGQARPQRPPAAPVSAWRRAAPSRAAHGLVALLTLAAALTVAGPPGFGPRPPAALLAAGLAAASALAPLPVEFPGADPAALAGRLGQRLALAPPAPDGLRLVGARLAPGAAAAAALYVYENARGERAVLMIEPLDEIAPAPLWRSAVGALSAAAWTGAGYGFVAAASRSDDLAALTAAAAATER